MEKVFCFFNNSIAIIGSLPYEPHYICAVGEHQLALFLEGGELMVYHVATHQFAAFTAERYEAVTLLRGSQAETGAYFISIKAGNARVFAYLVHIAGTHDARVDSLPQERRVISGAKNKF